MIKKETKYILIVKTLRFIKCSNLLLKEYKAETKYAWAAISNIINNNITTLLKSLYKSLSNLIPKKIECKKQQPKGKVVALSSVLKPSDIILNKLKEFNVSSIVKMASSYKFCVIATGEYDIYAARERANEWDYAAGHAVAQNAGAIIKTLDEKPFLYGKEDYKNPSLLILRSKNLND